jgi:CubicO group peptidase (beta-lactamase class C family)
MKKIILLVGMLTFLFACKDDNTPVASESPKTVDSTSIYFPPLAGYWESTSSSSLGWNTDSITSLYKNLQANDTRAFIVLKNGKIVLEEYWGKTLLGNTDFDADKIWYWASAAKTLTGFTVGKAEEDGLLNLSDKTSKYLGENWTSLTKEQQDKITVWHQLTMTSGLDDVRADDTSASSLVYKADAGTRWAYHNAPYTLLERVVENATGQDYNTYFNTVLQNEIGMTGYWQWSEELHLYLSNARSAARFGILMQNNGVWDGTRLLNKEFTDASITTSQQINKAYGYLWWLNGSESYHVPQSQIEFPGMFLPYAPADVYSAMGKNGQYVSISPSNGLVIIRMGDTPDQSLVPLLYLNDIWKMMMGVID